ncbi:MAG TPA: ABC transporter substrate-binding protein [Trebonia sp.]|nr:ABC transporter substrate-binding protein [Trebonia sp.]
MTIKISAKSGIAALAVAGIAAVTACSSSSSSSTSSPAATSASASTSSSASSGSNPLGGGAASGTVVIGSANFPENEVLAEVYALALQKAGVKVSTKLNIGAREVYYPQVEKGAITIIPEYNGTLLTVEVDKTSAAKSTADVDAALAAKLPSSLTVLAPAPAEDSDSITVTQATAAKYKLKSIADLTPVASQFVLGGPSEFKTRTDGVIGLKSVYGLTFKSFDPLDESGPITLAALTSGKVQAADVFTTTPQIVSDKLVSLTDPKNLFAAQNVIPLVYKPALTPTITSTLNALSAKLTTSALLALDVKVINDKEDYATAAQQWLTSVGLG